MVVSQYPESLCDSEKGGGAMNPEPSFLVSNLDIVLKAVFTLFGMLLSLVTLYLSYKRINNEILKEALEALQAGVAHSDDTFVEWAKKAKEDGKLTKEEREEALKIAKNKALELAKGPALDLLKRQGAAILNMWIKKIVEKNKNANKPA